MILGRVVKGSSPVFEFSVVRQGEWYLGAITSDIADFHANLFAEYEEIVNDQIFSLLDEIESSIASSGFLIELSDGQVCPAIDLQVFPSAMELAFKAC